MQILFIAPCLLFAPASTGLEHPVYVNLKLNARRRRLLCGCLQFSVFIACCRCCHSTTTATNLCYFTDFLYNTHTVLSTLYLCVCLAYMFSFNFEPKRYFLSFLPWIVPKNKSLLPSSSPSHCWRWRRRRHWRQLFCLSLRRRGTPREAALLPLLLLVIKIKCLRAVIETTSDGINFV